MKTEHKIIIAAVGGLALLAVLIALTQKPAQAAPQPTGTTSTTYTQQQQQRAACPF